jgi:cold shock CspA family protein
MTGFSESQQAYRRFMTEAEAKAKAKSEGWTVIEDEDGDGDVLFRHDSARNC